MSAPRESIALLINSLESFGGAQRVFVEDANRFAAEGVAVAFFLLYGPEGQYPFAVALDSRIRVVYLGARSPFDWRAMGRCAAIVKEVGAQAMLSTLNDGNLFARFVALRIGRSRLRLVVREANALSSKPWWQRVLDYLLSAVPYRIIAVSSEVQHSLVRGASRRALKVVLLPNAVPIPASHAKARGAPVSILSVGRLVPQKDHQTLIAALGLLARDGEEFSATIVGGGALRAELESQVRKEGLDSRIVFEGMLVHEEVLKRYASADLFVLPSRWEGSPNAALEAMANGLAVVAARVGGVPDLVVDHETGLLVPPGDSHALAEALHELIRDESLRDRLGRAGRARAERDFSPQARFARLRAIVMQP